MSFAAVAGPHSGRATPSLREAPQQQPMSTTGRGSTYRRRNAVQTNPATSCICVESCLPGFLASARGRAADHFARSVPPAPSPLARAGNVVPHWQRIGGSPLVSTALALAGPAVMAARRSWRLPQNLRVAQRFDRLAVQINRICVHPRSSLVSLLLRSAETGEFPPFGL